MDPDIYECLGANGAPTWLIENSHTAHKFSSKGWLVVWAVSYDFKFVVMGPSHENELHKYRYLVSCDFIHCPLGSSWLVNVCTSLPIRQMP